MPSLATPSGVAAAHAAAAAAFQSRPPAVQRARTFQPQPSAAPPVAPVAAAADVAPAAVIQLLLRGPPGSNFSKRFKVFGNMAFGLIEAKVRDLRRCSAVALTFDGQRLRPDQTPEGLGMQQNDIVECQFA